MSGTGRTRSRRTLARRADRYRCYQQAVQAPESEIAVIERVFAKQRGRPPRRLREDFCGTASLSCAWAAHHRDNHAIGIDIDPECLGWGRRHNLRELGALAQSRVKLVEGDVRDIGHEPVDVTAAFNFSYFILRTRPELLRYFRAAHASLCPDGILFLDVYGGPEAQQPLVTRRRFRDFTYVWEQKSFDPIGCLGTNAIHFEFPDGSALRNAFRYDWRLWSLPELRDLLSEAGFARSEVYWEGTDRRTGRGNEIYRRRERAEPDLAWIAWLVAYR
jgi:SAM-dependent methyltransferase